MLLLATRICQSELFAGTRAYLTMLAIFYSYWVVENGCVPVAARVLDCILLGFEGLQLGEDRKGCAFGCKVLHSDSRDLKYVYLDEYRENG
jgi:hypothetical protein